MAQCGDVTAGPYSAAPYDITFEYTEESQVVVYYIENRIEIFVPQNDPNYPWTFQHATRITFTSSIPPQPVYIRRSTDITPLKAEFQTGNAIRAQDLNKNFQQLADACNENQADYKCLQTELENFRQNVETSLQYTNVADVTTLNAVAVTNPDDQTGYDVLDSTGIDSAASPVVTGLPATAGGDPGEDPVNGVYWNSGIVTRVTWNRTSQSWTFISYYSRDGDNRYQQQTAVNAVTPNPADYKDGSLWFDSGDANLYILYNDGSSRQWVITNPLSAYGQIVTTSDVHWNRNAQTNTVYPKNSTDTIANYNSSGSIDSSGAAVFTSVTSSGAISGTSITGSGAISGTTITGSGAISGDSVAATNAVTGASVTATGNISSATLNTTGNVGIGTTSPSSFANFTNLTIQGGTSGSNLDFFNSSGVRKQAIVATASNGLSIETIDAGDINFNTNNTERMRIDSSGKVGIGTSSPQRPLHVNGTEGVARFTSTASGNNGFEVGIGTSSQAFLWQSENAYMQFATNNSERMRIDSSGNVGIGTTSNLLSSSTRTTLSLNNTGSAAVALGVNGTREGHIYADSSQMEISSVDNPMIFYAGSSERMRIDSSGRLLVGTSNSSANGTYSQLGFIQIEGHSNSNLGAGILTLRRGQAPSSITNNSDLGVISFASNDNNEFATIRGVADGAAGTNDYPGRLVFSTNPGSPATGPTERMRIDSSGRVGIKTASMGSLYVGGDDLVVGDGGASNQGMTIYTGTSNQGIIAFADGFTGAAQQYAGYLLYEHSNDSFRVATVGQERMRITNNSDGQLLIGTSNGSNSSGIGVKIVGGGASSVDVVTNAASNIGLNHVFNINATNNGYRYYLAMDGGIRNYSNNNVNLSDEREKKNIVDMDSTWSELKQWTLRQFHFNQQDDSEDKSYGVIAQQIETISPQVLSTFETNPTTTRKGVKEQKMMWMAIKALQEAQDRIETLEQRLTDAGL